MALRCSRPSPSRCLRPAQTLRRPTQLARPSIGRAHTHRSAGAADKTPQHLAARAKLTGTRALLDEAHAAPFSIFKLSGGVGIAPELTGTSAYSRDNDVSLSSGVALAWRIDLQGVVPLWTFGKIGHLWEAAEANVKVHAAGVEKERDLVRLEVRRAYYGLLLARDGILCWATSRSTQSAETALKEKVERARAARPTCSSADFASELDFRC